MSKEWLIQQPPELTEPFPLVWILFGPDLLLFFGSRPFHPPAVQTFIRAIFQLCAPAGTGLEPELCPCSASSTSCANTFGLQIPVKLSNQSGIQSTPDLLNAASVLSGNKFKYEEAFRVNVVSYSEGPRGIVNSCILLFFIYCILLFFISWNDQPSIF